MHYHTISVTSATGATEKMKSKDREFSLSPGWKKSQQLAWTSEVVELVYKMALFWTS